MSEPTTVVIADYHHMIRQVPALGLWWRQAGARLPRARLARRRAIFASRHDVLPWPRRGLGAARVHGAWQASRDPRSLGHGRV